MEDIARVTDRGSEEAHPPRASEFNLQEGCRLGVGHEVLAARTGPIQDPKRLREGRREESDQMFRLYVNAQGEWLVSTDGPRHFANGVRLEESPVSRLAAVKATAGSAQPLSRGGLDNSRAGSRPAIAMPGAPQRRGMTGGEPGARRDRRGRQARQRGRGG